MRRTVTLLSCLAAYSLPGQEDTLLLFRETEQIIESFYENQEDQQVFEYEGVFDAWESILSQPLDLNTVEAADLDIFPFLTQDQKDALIRYRRETGLFLSIYELQAIPGFSLDDIRRLLPYVQVGSSMRQSFTTAQLKEGTHQLIWRWTRSLQKKAGFTANGSRFEGDQNAIFLKYRFSLPHKLSVGVTAEKDAGESFLSGSNPHGFDFYSAHLYFKDLSPKLKEVILGDYTISFGQGLLIYTGLATGKSYMTSRIRQTGKPLRPYTSVNEFDFFRGMAATCSVSEQMDLTLFASGRQMDANLVTDQSDSRDSIRISSLQMTGKHRTQSEIQDEKAVWQWVAGSSLKWQSRRWHLAANTLVQTLQLDLEPRPALYNRYNFRGRDLFNASIDYGYVFRNFHFLGETAYSSNGALATVNGLVLSMDSKLDIAILYRNLPAGFQSLFSQPFAESSAGNNESGIYLGMTARFSNRLSWQMYYDSWTHNWLRFRTDAPSSGYEWLARLTYHIKRKLDIHLQIRQESKMENQNQVGNKQNLIDTRLSQQLRFHLSYQLSRSLEWRTRFYLGTHKSTKQEGSGVTLLQDIRYSPVGSPFAFSSRYALFDSGIPALRFYAFENDVQQSYSIPGYYGRGSRFYLLIRYRFPRGIRLEARYARTFFDDRQMSGSGLEEVEGPVRGECKLQLRWNW